MLFEEKKRTGSEYKAYGESTYNFLDRSALELASNVRKFLNHWVSQLPDKEAKDIISRYKKGGQTEKSATFELILFAIMTKLGCKLQIHPDLKNGSKKHPDFLVTTPEGEEFYLEAVLASESSSDEQIAAENRKNVVLDSIDRLESPNFFLGIDAVGNPDTPPKGRALRRKLEKWLESLDPDAVAREVDQKDFNSLPTMECGQDNWSIKFTAIPKSPESRDAGQRAIGMLPGSGGWVNAWEPVKKVIRSKGSRYGELDKPLLIAVNYVDVPYLKKIDEMQALFGQEKWRFNPDDRNAQPEMRRIPNGAWVGRKGPEYKRISGAWLFDGINPWNMIHQRNTLYFNPWASFTLPDFMKKFNHALVVRDKMDWADGLSLSEIFELPASWPE